MALDFRSRRSRNYPGANPGLGAQSAEKATLRLLHDLELRIGLMDTELIEGGVLGFLDGLGRHFYPFHLLAVLV